MWQRRPCVERLSKLFLVSLSFFSLLFKLTLYMRWTMLVRRVHLLPLLDNSHGMNACSVPQSCLFDPIDCSPPGSSVCGILQQKCWSRLLFPPPGDLPNSGMELLFPVSPALAGRFFATEPPGEWYEFAKFISLFTFHWLFLCFLSQTCCLQWTFVSLVPMCHARICL